METKEKRSEQANLTGQARRLDRKTLSPLGRVTLVALLGTVLMNTSRLLVFFSWKEYLSFLSSSLSW